MSKPDDIENQRLREALTWAVGFIKCNLPKTSQQYPDMRNAESLVANAPVIVGEFQRISARAEVIEAEYAKFRQEVVAVLEHIPPEYHVQVREGGGPENLAATLAVTVAKLVNALRRAKRS